MGAWTEDAADVFDFDTDWKELVADNGAGGSSFSQDSQESTRIGRIPANKKRSAIRFFLGYAQADTGSPWRLRREQPYWDPEHPNLFAHSISFSPTVVESNASNPGKEPYNESPFSPNNFSARYKYVLATVKYRAFRCLFLPDSAIAAPQYEYLRNVITSTEARLDVLSADGVSQLKFAETNTGGPTAGTTPFPAPIAVLQPKATFVLEWLNVDRAYLSANPHIFFPQKILDCMGKVNSAAFLGCAAGCLLCQPPEFVEQPWPVVSEDSDQSVYSVLRSVTVRIKLDYFDPLPGAASPATRGHNLMVWRRDGKYYLATRDGTTNLNLALLQYADFTQIFTHVSS